MGLFRRKHRDDARDDRCPVCSEPVRHGALECMMCGIDLRPLRSAGERSGDQAGGGGPRAR
jgi:hypothetical protein